MKVLCVAEDAEHLAELKRSVVTADWELCAGATTEADAIAQAEAERPHVLVVWGPFEPLARQVRERYPAIRIITDRELPESDAVASSLGQLRDAVRSTSRPRGPVR